MTPDEYIALAIKTTPADYPHLWSDNVNEHVMHASIGVVTEAGELLDAVKKSVIYGKIFDQTNADEEVGDILWYLALYCFATGTTFEAIMQQNITKLQTRYPDKFTPEAALNRDIAAEVAALESVIVRPEETATDPAFTRNALMQTTLTRAYIKLNASQPRMGNSYIYDGMWWDFDGVQWVQRRVG